MKTPNNRPFSIETVPASGCDYRLLCEDRNGVYCLPFPCQWMNGVWRSRETGIKIKANVVGWREWEEVKH